MKWFYKRVCIIDTMYSLSLYFLLTKSVEEFENTLFVVSKGIPTNIIDKLPNVIYEDNIYDFLLENKKLLLRLRLIRCLKYNWRFLFAKHYALDHLPFSSQYIGFSRYVLLEDSPGFFNLADQYSFLVCPSVKKNFMWYLHSFLYHGVCWKNCWGQNFLCKNIIISDSRDATSLLLKKKKVTIVNLRKLWEEKEDKDKNWFLSFLGLNIHDLEKWKKAETIILTQPWITDDILTEEEYLSCYIGSIEKFKKTGVIIKPHPRDYFDWHKHFPDLHIMNTVVPMQILCFMGLKFKRAITISSTAVSSFPSDTEIVKLGHQISPKLRLIYRE